MICTPVSRSCLWALGRGGCRWKSDRPAISFFSLRSWAVTFGDALDARKNVAGVYGGAHGDVDGGVSVAGSRISSVFKCVCVLCKICTSVWLVPATVHVSVRVVVSAHCHLPCQPIAGAWLPSFDTLMPSSPYLLMSSYVHISWRLVELAQAKGLVRNVRSTLQHTS